MRRLNRGNSWWLPRLLLLCILPVFAAAGSGGGTLIVGNTRDDTVPATKVSTLDGTVAPFITANLVAPDFFKLYNGSLYVASGDDANTSSIVRFTEANGTFIDVFAKGGGLIRPYGFDFSNDTLYVASFRTDQILTYSAKTGAHTGVFAQGNGTREGLCNGPNHLAIVNRTLYLTTQGSTVINGTLEYPGLPSEVVRYDLDTGVGAPFIAQPEPLPGGLGYVSLLGLLVDCDRSSPTNSSNSGNNSSKTCVFYTTDFAGGLRAYAGVVDGSGDSPTLLYAVETTYTPGASTGALALGDDGAIYVPAFVSENVSGVVLKFSQADGASLNGGGGYFIESSDLVRPIGVLYIPPAGNATTPGTAASPAASPAAAPPAASLAGPVTAPAVSPVAAPTSGASRAYFTCMTVCLLGMRVLHILV